MPYARDTRWCVWITLPECSTSFEFSHGPFFHPGFSFQLQLIFEPINNTIIPVCCAEDAKGKARTLKAGLSHSRNLLTNIFFYICWPSFIKEFFFDDKTTSNDSMGTFSMCSRKNRFSVKKIFFFFHFCPEDFMGCPKLASFCIENGRSSNTIWRSGDVFVVSFNLSIHLCLFMYGFSLVRAVHTLALPLILWRCLLKRVFIVSWHESPR